MLFNKQFSKTVIVSSLMLSMTLQSFEVAARVGGSSRSSSNSSHAVSSSSYSSQRVGGGNSAGMQRQDVMNNARQNSAPTQSAAAVAPTQNAGPTSTTQPAKPGYGLGTVVGAAAAGAAVGYIANSAMHNNQPVQTGGTGSYNDPLNQERQAPNQGFPWGTVLMFLLMAAAIIGIFMHLSRKREATNSGYKPVNMTNMAALETPMTSSSQVNSIENQNFERNALKFFNELQEANNRGDISFMQTQTIEPLKSILIADIQNRSNASRTQVMMMNPKLLDMTEEVDRSIASVRFTGMVREDENAAPDNVDEVWHFVRLAKSSNDWQLAGIEQV